MTPLDIKFPDADAYPKWVLPAALAGGIPLYFWFAVHEENPLRGFVAALSACSVIAAFITLRQWRNYLSFWLAMSLNVLFHCWLVSAIWGSDSHFPGIIFTPVVIADLLLWQFIAVTLIRTLRR